MSVLVLGCDIREVKICSVSEALLRVQVLLEFVQNGVVLFDYPGLLMDRLYLFLLPLRIFQGHSFRELLSQAHLLIIFFLANLELLGDLSVQLVLGLDIFSRLLHLQHRFPTSFLLLVETTPQHVDPALAFFRHY